MLTMLIRPVLWLSSRCSTLITLLHSRHQFLLAPSSSLLLSHKLLYLFLIQCPHQACLVELLMLQLLLYLINVGCTRCLGIHGRTACLRLLLLWINVLKQLLRHIFRQLTERRIFDVSLISHVICVLQLPGLLINNLLKLLLLLLHHLQVFLSPFNHRFKLKVGHQLLVDLRQFA